MPKCDHLKFCPQCQEEAAKSKFEAGELALLERRGKELQAGIQVLEELAESPIADEDAEDESQEIITIKRLIIRARAIRGELK